MQNSIDGYSTIIKDGDSVQDARGCLPENIHTSIIVKLNLRTLHDMAELRLCKRTQGEYQQVFKLMKSAVVKVHPWAEDFMKVYCANHATCCFPNYTGCPIQDYTLDRKTKDDMCEIIEREFEATEHEAVPVATNGKTM